MPLRVDIESNLDLRHAAGRGGNAGELEAAQGLVIIGHGAFALQHMNFNGSLAVRSGGEHLALLGGDGGVAVDELGEDVAYRFPGPEKGA